VIVSNNRNAAVARWQKYYAAQSAEAILAAKSDAGRADAAV
jgi:hypothetical protein